MSLLNKVTKHYTKNNLSEKIFEVLQEMGKDLEHLTPEDLAPASEFHTRGLEATRELALLAELKSGTKVLDVGCGLGGPARTLASEFGCSVSGVDLTEEYIRSGNELNKKVGLDKQVPLRQADALNLPFENDSFDVVWTQHAQMNIEDKASFYKEMHRVLKPGGTLAFHDIFKIGEEPLYFPVPWARESSFSFLIDPDKVRSILADLGFQEIKWLDKTDVTIDWFREYREKLAKEEPSPLNFTILLGSDFKVMSENMVQNLERGRVGIYQGILKK